MTLRAPRVSGVPLFPSRELPGSLIFRWTLFIAALAGYIVTIRHASFLWPMSTAVLCTSIDKQETGPAASALAMFGIGLAIWATLTMPNGWDGWIEVTVVAIMILLLFRLVRE
jgi:hypothetical protein